jgi:hypothetical protein
VLVTCTHTLPSAPRHMDRCRVVDACESFGLQEQGSEPMMSLTMATRFGPTHQAPHSSHINPAIRNQQHAWLIPPTIFGAENIKNPLPSCQPAHHNSVAAGASLRWASLSSQRAYSCLPRCFLVLLWGRSGMQAAASKLKASLPPFRPSMTRPTKDSLQAPNASLHGAASSMLEWGEATPRKKLRNEE